MLTNFHTHTNYCDGKNTPEEIVKAAIEKGFSSIGFSGHGYTPYDLEYCTKDVKGYAEEIQKLKEKYKDKIKIFLGIEEDMYAFADRGMFDYIIGSAHYFKFEDKCYPVDDNYNTLKSFVLYCGSAEKAAECYYESFCDYILKRKPDIVGHFDLITKYDEGYEPLFTGNEICEKIAEKYLIKAIEADCVFEVNTASSSKKYRFSPYPSEKLLYIIKKHNGKVILSSDCHCVEDLDFGFEKARYMLKNIGFKCLYYISENGFEKEYI